MANLGVYRYFLRNRQKSRRTERKVVPVFISQTGSDRSHDEESSYSPTEERSYLRFIPLVTKIVPNNTPDSSSLTRKSHEIPFEMEKVEQFEMSPGEKYLVTYTRAEPSDPDPEGLWLKFFDVTSGKGLFGVNDVAYSHQWHVIRWAGGKDDKYIATLSKNNIISLYEIDTKSIRLLGEKPLDLGHDVVDISLPPTEPVLTILLKGHGNDPAKALLLRIPDMVVLTKSDLPPGVVLDDCKMHWQSNGEYLAVSTRSGFVFFCIKEEGILL